jgi:hypothetical protein
VLIRNTRKRLTDDKLAEQPGCKIHVINGGLPVEGYLMTIALILG